MATEKTTIRRRFAGRDRIFRLRLGEIEQLEAACGSGVGGVFVRLATLQHKVADIRETIRLALIGGGLVPSQADQLVEDYVDGAPLVENQQLAVDILEALHNGVKDAEKDMPETSGKAGGSGNPATSPLTSPPDLSQASDLTTSGV